MDLALFKRLPPWAKPWMRRFLLLVNVALLAHILAQAADEGVGLEIAQYWIALTCFMSQASLLWHLVRCPRTTAPRLSVQCLGIFAVCHIFRLLGASRWSMDVMDLHFPSVNATLAVLVLGLAVWHRRSIHGGQDEPDAETVVKLSREPFGAELVRRLQGPGLAAACQRQPIGFLWSLLEHSVLPIAALLVGLLLELVLGLGSGQSRWPAWVTSWHQSLETLALLPQLRALLALRTEGDGCKGSVLAVPQDLTYWLTCMAVGHFFAFITAVTDSLAPSSGHRAWVFAAGEGMNAAVLGELLAAHFRAKWLGQKNLILPA